MSRFIDKVQWKILKNLVLDKYISSIVICSQFPIIALGETVNSFAAPASVPKGDIIPWQPTKNDIEVFLRFFISWMLPDSAQTEIRIDKNVAIVSSSTIPHSTLIQDMNTGLRIQQLCVGNFGLCRESSESTIERISRRDIVMNGKIGSFRYTHVLEAENMVVDSSRDGPSLAMTSSAENLSSDPRPGFGVMRIWFDTWKSNGSWKMISETQGAQKPPGNAVLTLGPVLGVPYLVQSGDKEAFMLPILLEADRKTRITIAAQSAFTSEIGSWNFDLKARRPIVCVIGPLDVESRYNADIVSGIKAERGSSFSISTHLNWAEANIAVINSDPVSDSTPCSELVKDLVKRCKVPFSGITAVVNVNIQPHTMALDELTVEPLLVKGLAKCRHDGKMSGVFRGYLKTILERVRDLFRDLFSRPSYKELLKSSFNLMMQAKNLLIVDKNKISDAAYMINLMVDAVNREYLHQLTWYCHSDNHNKQHNASMALADESDSDREPGDDDDDALTLLTKGNGQNIRRTALDDKEYFRAGTIDGIFSTWLQAKPQPDNAPDKLWKPWISPNGKVSVEMLGDVNLKSLPQVIKSIDAGAIDTGTRILVLTGGAEGDDIAKLQENNDHLGLKFQKRILKWSQNRPDRAIAIVNPSRKYGTQYFSLQLTPKGSITGMYSVDSLLRFTDYERNKMLLDKITEVKRLAAAASNGATGKGKKAKQQKEEEERRLFNFKKAEVDEIFKSVLPDGFVIIECRTSTLESPGKVVDVLTTVQPKILGSTNGREASIYDDKPSYYDYLQLPEWLLKFAPAGDGVFVQDEVIIVMRDDPTLQRVLDVIEGDDIFIHIMQLYEQSRLSELSRPPELREVDMDQPGTIDLFLKDLVARMWEEVVPFEVKPFIISLNDDFVRSFSLSRAMPDHSALASPQLFAKAMQQALRTCCALMLCMKMKDIDRWKYILTIPDGPTTRANRMAAWDQKVAKAIAKGKLRDPIRFDEMALVKEMEAKEAIRSERENEYESDMEDLAKEEKAFQREEEEKIAQEERAQRMEDDKAAEEAELADLEPLEEIDPELDEMMRLRLEAKQVKVKLRHYEFQSAKASFEAIIEIIVSEAIEEYIAEEEKELELSRIALESGNTDAFDARIAQAQQQMGRLAKLRVEARRTIGPKLTYLSSDFLV